MTILFFHFDGTCNDPTDAEHYQQQDISITNVLKSHLWLGGTLSAASTASRLPSGAVSFYYSGVGTYGSSAARYINAGLAIEQGDVASILNQALFDFQSYFHDRISLIVLIGFSRGAALARRFAALLDGLLQRPIVIEAVMDTVASIGLPNLDKAQRPAHEVVFEYGGTLPSCVRNALHLVALDEQRLAFRPTLMNHDERVEEVWLAGVHSDIGGGYRYDGLADISLTVLMRWLETQLQQSVYQQQVACHEPWLTPDMLAIRHNPLGIIHYQDRLPLYRHLTLAPRHCHVLKQGVPCAVTAPRWHTSVSYRQMKLPNYQPLARCVSKPSVWQMPEHLSPDSGSTLILEPNKNKLQSV
ncbi:T6SS phospholipase effector Tle1-like catalytic domain-containing protein [Marinomonas ostreistagni]|uniref:DUF2235 domain-containing protein n=1 Tax=Marinomonas ostreistagni TaxID=359209 RepID=A0ABS0ZCV5_9GAMM|nr:DUF2235 domain-containing protein [Marinomonas ostreistagni]MBJ7551503.1 DUF2235 domain-containing protein [Marinomonas ostreistagni]